MNSFNNPHRAGEEMGSSALLRATMEAKSGNQRRRPPSRRLISTSISILSALGTPLAVTATTGGGDYSAVSSTGSSSFSSGSGSGSSLRGPQQEQTTRRGHRALQPNATDATATAVTDGATQMTHRRPPVPELRHRHHPAEDGGEARTTDDGGPYRRPHRTPYHPVPSERTCVADANYPEHYLYDVATYFFSDPGECCAVHFADDAGECLRSVKVAKRAAEFGASAAAAAEAETEAEVDVGNVDGGAGLDRMEMKRGAAASSSSGGGGRGGGKKQRNDDRDEMAPTSGKKNKKGGSNGKMTTHDTAWSGGGEWHEPAWGEPAWDGWNGGGWNGGGWDDWHGPPHLASDWNADWWGGGGGGPSKNYEIVGYFFQDDTWYPGPDEYIDASPPPMHHPPHGNDDDWPKDAAPGWNAPYPDEWHGPPPPHHSTSGGGMKGIDDDDDWWHAAAAAAAEEEEWERWWYEGEGGGKSSKGGGKSSKSKSAKFPKGSKLAKSKASKSSSGGSDYDWSDDYWSHPPPEPDHWDEPWSRPPPNLPLHDDDHGTSGPATSGPPAGAIGTPTVNRFNYCGATWADANSKCGPTCPLGTDAECPPGETCFSDATSCPSSTVPEMQVMSHKKKKGAWRPPGETSGKKKSVECPNPLPPRPGYWRRRRARGVRGLQGKSGKAHATANGSKGSKQAYYAEARPAKSGKAAVVDHNHDLYNNDIHGPMPPPPEAPGGWHGMAPMMGHEYSSWHAVDDYWQDMPAVSHFEHQGMNFDKSGKAKSSKNHKMPKMSKASKSKGSKSESWDDDYEWGWEDDYEWSADRWGGGQDDDWSVWSWSADHHWGGDDYPVYVHPSCYENIPPPGDYWNGPNDRPPVPTHRPTKNPSGSDWGGGGKPNGHNTPTVSHPTWSTTHWPTKSNDAWGDGDDGTVPTYMPTTQLPTYAPTSSSSELWSGGGWWNGGWSWNDDGWWGGGWNDDGWWGGWGGGWGGGAWPTYYPTPDPAGGSPTVSSRPTVSSKPTVSSRPTVSSSPTISPAPNNFPGGTLGPSVNLDNREVYSLCAWGSPLASSQDECCDILKPMEIGIDVIAAAAGSKYSLVIYPDGSAHSTGYVDDINDYHGHLGLKRIDVKAGQNMWKQISQVFDPRQGGIVDPPMFQEAYAGVEAQEQGGEIHSILLDVRGNAWSFGANSKGQLCLGSTQDQMIPHLIDLPNIVDVAVGGEHTLLLTRDGKVYGCGSNEKGQLGLTEFVSNVMEPTEVTLLPSHGLSVSAGKDHSLIMAKDGDYVMGSNEYGQLCIHTNKESVYVPREFDIDDAATKNFEATRFSSYILYTDGGLCACGANSFGQLGDGTNVDFHLTRIYMPEGKGNEIVKLLGVGPSAYHVFYVSKNGNVWGTGLNDRGQLGVGDTNNRNEPTLVHFPDDTTAHALMAAETHSLGFCEGSRSEKTWTPTYSPTEGGGEVTSTPTYVPTSGYPTYSPTESGSGALCVELYNWGCADAIGQDKKDMLIPEISGEGVAHASAGEKYTIIILDDGSALASGYVESFDDYQGHLGLDPGSVVQGVNKFGPMSVYDKAQGAKVNPPKFVKVFTGVEAVPDSGIIHSILLDDRGRVWATGSNSKGQLCLGDSVDRDILEMIPTPGRIIDVGIGGEHTLLLSENGKVYGCGSNDVGQLGLGSQKTRSSPTELDSVGSVTSISAGHSHSLFIARQAIYSTGSNKFGQLCADSGGANVLTPQALDIKQGVVVSFEAIKETSYILYDDGSVNGCGRNNFGQIGDGTNANQSTKEVKLGNKVVGLLGVGPSAQSVFFSTQDNNVWGTGLNDRGQLGVGDTENRNLPTMVKFQDQVKIELISAAQCHALALREAPCSNPQPTLPTYMPTYSPTFGEAVTNMPTYMPTFGEAVTTVPTFGPTFGDLATTLPTGFPTYAPTFVETIIGEDICLYFWGSPPSFGSDAPTEYVVPFESRYSSAVAYTSAGSMYSLLVLADGSAHSAGFIPSKLDYQGHLGVASENVVQGINDFLPISLVYDPEVGGVQGGGIVDAPRFDKVFAGVENSPGSGTIHTILLDLQGRAWATGSNENGQLCIGGNVGQVNIPEKIMGLQGRIIDVAVGGEHTLLLDEFGNVYGCGSNFAGQLGLGTASSTSVPTIIGGLPFVRSISAGHSHSLFLTERGFYFTGSNEFGQLCAETNGQNLYIPEVLDFNLNIIDDPLDFIVSVDAIKHSSYLLFRDGSVSSCGKNNAGQLGDGTTVDKRLALVDLDGVGTVRLIGTGPSAESVFFVASDERVWATGLNDMGQLGVGDKLNRSVPTAVGYQQVLPVQVMSAAEDHTLALGLCPGTVNPGMYTPTFAPTYTETIIETVFVPTPSPTYTETIIETVFVPTPSPTIGTYIPTFAPTGEPIPTMSPTYFEEVRSPTSSPTTFETYLPTITPTSTLSPTMVGTTYLPTMIPTSILTSVGFEMYHWGSQASVGESSVLDITRPLNSGIFVSGASAGSQYSIIVLSDGTASSGGFIESTDDYDGHMGVRGSDVSAGENPFQPIKNVFDEGNNVIIGAPFFVQAYAGASSLESPGSIHSLLIDIDGQAWVTGSNAKGQLCLGDFENRLIPQKVPIEGTVVSAAVGSEHTLLLLDDGSVYGCGSNELGQIGLGEAEEVNTPTRIEGLGTVESVSAGLAFSLFKSNDGLYVTGNNFYGQLCDDATFGNNVVNPIMLDNLDINLVSMFHAIKTTSYILFNDGSVGACGRNNFGQLGDGTEIDRVRTVIEPLPDNLPIQQIGVGPSSESAFFINEVGDVYATGLNDRGQLGVGDNTNRNELTLVEFEEGVAVQHISASGDHTLSY